jgi:hypothetical protein
MLTRRRLPRHLADWPGTYHFDHLEIADGDCRVLDISRMGVGVEVFGDTPVDPVGHRVIANVRGPAGGSIGIHMEGQIRNVSLGSAGGVRLGIEFVGLSDVEQGIVDSLEQMQIAW